MFIHIYTYTYNNIYIYTYIKTCFWKICDGDIVEIVCTCPSFLGAAPLRGFKICRHLTLAGAGRRIPPEVRCTCSLVNLLGALCCGHSIRYLPKARMPEMCPPKGYWVPSQLKKKYSIKTSKTQKGLNYFLKNFRHSAVSMEAYNCEKYEIKVLQYRQNRIALTYGSWISGHCDSTPP